MSQKERDALLGSVMARLIQLSMENHNEYQTRSHHVGSWDNCTEVQCDMDRKLIEALRRYPDETPAPAGPTIPCPECKKAGRLDERDGLFRTAGDAKEAGELCPTCEGDGTVSTPPEAAIGWRCKGCRKSVNGRAIKLKNCRTQTDGVVRHWDGGRWCGPVVDDPSAGGGK